MWCKARNKQGLRYTKRVALRAVVARTHVPSTQTRRFMNVYAALGLAGWLLAGLPTQAQVPAGQHITAVVPLAPGPVPRYGKFEVGLTLDRAFLADTLGSNPFDPADVAVEATFTGPSGQTVVRPGFYYQEFSIQDKYLVANDARYWQPAPTPQPWRVRFAPDEAGPWQYVLKVTYRDGTTETLPPQPFECVASANKGFLKVAANRRNLVFDQGQPFFAIGSNVDYWGDNALALPALSSPSSSTKNVTTCAAATKVMTLPAKEQRKFSTYTYTAYQQVFANLREVKGTFARVWMQDYNWDMETYDPATKVNTLGYYQPSQPRMYDLDRMLAAATAAGVAIQLSMLDGIRLWNTGSNKKWATFPYAVGLGFGPAEQLRFFTEPAARQLFKNKIRYIVARWGYSPAIAGYELLNEGDFINAGALFGQNNRQDVQPLLAWTLEMASYLKALDARHLQTLAYGPENSYQLIQEHPELFDYAVSHDYTASFNAEVRRSYLTQAMTRLHDKPYQLQEVDYAPYINTAYQTKFHSVFWATAFSGAFGIALPLSAFANLHHPCYPAYKAYLPLARFLAATKFSSEAANQPIGNAAGAATTIYGRSYAAALGQDIHRPLFTGLPDSLEVAYFSPCDRQCPPGWQQSVGIAPFFTDPLDRGDLNQNDKPAYLVTDITTTNDGLIEVYALRNPGKITGWVHNKTHYWYNLPHSVQANGFCEGNSCSVNPYVSKNLNNTTSNTITPLVGQRLVVSNLPPDSARVSYRVQWFYTHLGVDADGDGKAGNGGFIKSLEQPAVVPVGGRLVVAIPPLVALGTNGPTSAPDYAFYITKNLTAPASPAGLPTKARLAPKKRR